MATKAKRYNEYVEAAELSKRFPDLTDEEVCDKVAEICDIDWLNPRSAVGIIVLVAYEGGLKAAKRTSESMFGIDFTKSK